MTKKMDKARLAGEFEEIRYQAHKQLFSKIPGISAIAGFLVGSWVVSTFTTSPVKGFLSSVGLMRGGTRLVSTGTYKFLSLFLPLMISVITAYIVQKALKKYRERRLERNMAYVAELGQAVQSQLHDKVKILDQAKGAGLISDNEYQAKMANLYQSYSRNFHSKIEELIIKKLEG
ncbi:MAG: hypothetical protein ACE144_16585 [Thermodesulfobacteriota bacterium]